MRTARIAIIGGGLSGLYAAYLLEKKGISDYLLIEARPMLGGRIASATALGCPIIDAAATQGDIDRFDLGPSWFWPSIQPELGRVVHDLGLNRFEQHETGDMLFERAPNSPAVRMRGYSNSPASMRLVGGMGTMIDALRRRLDSTKIMTGVTVHRLHASGTDVEIICENGPAVTTIFQAERVLLAMPPRLAENSLQFTPKLPQTLAMQWRTTGTWMAPHAKYFAFYDSPFWREQGLSGAARSAIGPLTDIHDASMPDGSAALFGFFGVSARIRKKVSDTVLRENCRAQLVRLFGPQAARIKGEIIKDWSQEPFTSTAADLTDPGQHDMTIPDSTISSAPWRGRLIGIGSEWSQQFPGYLAGAIDAATRGVQFVDNSFF